MHSLYLPEEVLSIVARSGDDPRLATPAEGAQHLASVPADLAEVIRAELATL